jgi:hypothetical protein
MPTEKNIIYKMPELKLDEILSAYIGKPDKCMCGCSGNYYHPSINQKIAAEKQGYELSPDEINDRKVGYVLSRIRAVEGNGIEVFNDYIYTAIIGQKQYTIYKLVKE